MQRDQTSVSRKQKRNGSKTHLRKTQKITIALSQKGIEHLRDLMSVKIMTLDGPVEISRELAKIEFRDKEETKIWRSIVKACNEMKIVIGAAAPDHVVYMSGASPMTVYKVT